jgi:hypothetical protein
MSDKYLDDTGLGRLWQRIGAAFSPKIHAHTGTDSEKVSYTDLKDKPDAPPGTPAGGTTGQILVKKSNEDYDFEWVDDPFGLSTLEFGPETKTTKSLFIWFKEQLLGSR